MIINEFNLIQWYSLVFTIYFLNMFGNKHFKTKRIESYTFYNSNPFMATITIIILVYLASLRTGIGDTQTYISHFINAPDSFEAFLKVADWSGEWGFLFINYFIKNFISSDPQIYLLILSGLSFYLVFKTFYQYGEMFDVTMYIFIAAGSYITAMNGMRQFLVASIVFYTFNWIYEKKYFRCIILYLLLSTIHKSVILFIPIVFFLNTRAWEGGTKFLLITGAVLYITFPVTNEIYVYFLKDTQYSIYGEGILTGTSGSANFIRVLVSVVPLFLSYLLKSNLKKIPYINIFVNCSVLNFIFMLLASASSWIFARYCIYYSLFSYVLLSWCIKYSGKQSKLIKLICFLCYLVFFYFEVRILF